MRKYVERLEARTEEKLRALETPTDTTSTTQLDNIEQQLQELTRCIKELKTWAQVATCTVAHTAAVISTPKVQQREQARRLRTMTEVTLQAINTSEETKKALAAMSSKQITECYQ